MTRPTCLDCGKVVDVRAGYHDCPGTKTISDIHVREKERATLIHGYNVALAKAKHERDEARKERDYAIEVQTRQVEDNRRLEWERDEARAELKTIVEGSHAALAMKSRDLAQRDRRIAELEAALRETLVPLKALQLADGHNWSPVVREQFTKAEPMALAALSAAAQPATTATTKEPDAWAYEQWTLCPRCSGPSSSLCNKCRDEVAAPPSPAAPLIVGRKVISEPGASIRLEVLELSEEAQRGLSVGKEAAENFLRAPSVVREAMRCRTCDYLTDVLICTKCGTPSPAARGSELLNALMGACQKGPGEEVNAAFSELLDYVVGLERGASAVISSNRDEDAAWTAHKALVQARATIKLAVECEDGIDGAQAEVTFRMIAAALAALDAARSKETK
jgi:hypothetical protein